MSKADHWENLALDLILGAVPSGWTRPSALNTVEIGLFTSDPGEATGGTEWSGGGYSRLSITNNGTSFGAASSGVKTNAVDFYFGTASGSWTSLTHWVLFDSSGNRYYKGSLPGAPLSINSGDQFIIRSGSLTISED